MTATILDGEMVARQIRREAAERVAALQACGRRPGLAVVIAGEDPASVSYVRAKTRACERAGVYCDTINLSADVTQDELLGLISDINGDSRFHGLLVQQPLPPQIDEGVVVRAVLPEKDVDGLHPFSLGLLLRGEPRFVPCTPAGIVELLLRTGHDPAGCRVAILGRSPLVGTPLAALLMQKRPGGNATVTVCHTATRDLAAVTREADIVVAAIGRPCFVTADMVGEGAVVIDVGINRVADASDKRGYRLTGDVDFEAVAAKASAITPVPGGVGPMTVAMLVANTVKAACGSEEPNSDGGPPPKAAVGVG